MNRRNQW